MREPRERKAVIVHPLLWVVEPLELDPTLVVRPMFGGKAVYVRGRFVLFLVAKEEPWRGVLFPTEREHHPSLRADFPSLQPHPVLPKWLYLSDETDDFDRIVAKLVQCVRTADLRFGIEPQAKKKRKRTRLKRKRD